MTDGNQFTLSEEKYVDFKGEKIPATTLVLSHLLVDRKRTIDELATELNTIFSTEKYNRKNVSEMILDPDIQTHDFVTLTNAIGFDFAFVKKENHKTEETE